MRRFGYWRDPAFIVGCCAYTVNRWLIKPHFHSTFFHGHFNDLWLIPCALPPVLWLQRRIGLRKHDLPPTLAEIAFHLVVWSVLFEYLGPKIMPWTTGDPLDVIAYAIGAIVAACWWHRPRMLAASDEL